MKVSARRCVIWVCCKGSDVMKNDVIIRDMLPEDIDGKGTVHYQSWQETYQGIVDANHLEWLSEERCREIAHRWPQNTAVAVVGDKVVGFGCWSPCQNDPTAAELVALYVLEEYKGGGGLAEGWQTIAWKKCPSTKWSSSGCWRKTIMPSVFMNTMGL